MATQAVRWQYYMTNVVDGKKIGWHNYETDAAAQLETKWQEQADLGVMLRTTWHLKSGWFKYEVNLGTMTQKNMESGTVRHIRRLGVGERATNGKPRNTSTKHKAVDLNDTTTTTTTTTTASTSSEPATKKLKATQTSIASSLPSIASSSSSSSSTSDPLMLASLFNGQHGECWAKSLSVILKSAPNAAKFIGPGRDKTIMPIRELTFQAIKPNPPAAWRVIAFGQNPYPRIESATGIAMFDNQIDSWENSAFGKAVSMRCIIKAAAMHKHNIALTTAVADLRASLKKWDTVTPPQWFEAMLSQGVLLLNAALSIGGDLSKSEHVTFWKPVICEIVREILRSKRALPKGHPNKSVVMLWWGNESLKVKKILTSVCNDFADVPIVHMEHCNPAAQGDAFCKGAVNHFSAVNKSLKNLKMKEIDWLPTKKWLAKNSVSTHSSFITETQDLHKMYLERLQSGLQRTVKMEPITGILQTPISTLSNSCNQISQNLSQIAEQCVKTAEQITTNVKELTKDEKGAIYMYTGNSLYSSLNAALRDSDRKKSKKYFEYLHLFIKAHNKLPGKQSMTLYRGIGKDLTKEYQQGSTVTWWAVSSCTPKMSVAQAFGGGQSNGTLFHVKTTTAVPIMHLSAYKGEEEYILAPRTQLKVVSVKKTPGKAGEIILQELTSERLVR